MAYCGFRARSALEIVDSGNLRLTRIIKLIEASRFSVHDISRVELDPESELPRFNMPIELGIALGMKHLGRSKLRDHHILVLDAAKSTERHRYQKFASDLASTDIKEHGGEVELVISAVRDFLSPHTEAPTPGMRGIRNALADFERTLPALAAAARQELEELSFVDRLRHAAAFIARSA